jgi:hypothetical protein
MDPQLLTSLLLGGEHCAMKTHGEVTLWTYNYWPQNKLEVSTAPRLRMWKWSYGPTIIDLSNSWRWALRHEDALGIEAMDPLLLKSVLVGGEHCAMKTHGWVKLWTHNYWTLYYLGVSTAPWRRMGDWSYEPTIIDLSTSWRWALRHEGAWGSEAMDPQWLTSVLVGGEHCVMKTKGGVKLWTHNYWPLYYLEMSTAPWRRMGEWSYGPTIIDLSTTWRWELRHEGIWGSEAMDPQLLTSRHLLNTPTTRKPQTPIEL